MSEDEIQDMLRTSWRAELERMDDPKLQRVYQITLRKVLAWWDFPESHWHWRCDMTAEEMLRRKLLAVPPLTPSKPRNRFPVPPQVGALAGPDDILP